MRNRNKIFIPSFYDENNEILYKEQKLRELYLKSNQKYCLVDNPRTADIILIIKDFVGTQYESDFFSHLLREYPKKCFSVSHNDDVSVIIRGIYANANKCDPYQWQRSRTGSYMLLRDGFKNPFILSHEDTDNNQDKKWLFSFIGRNCHPVREKALKLNYLRSDVIIEDSSNTFDLWRLNGADKINRQRYYYEVLVQSKFSLCLRVAVPNSIRLFESLQLGVSPVIVSDAFKYPKGPKWKDFCIIIKEKHLQNLEKIVSLYENDHKRMGLLAKAAFEEFFSEKTYFNYVADSCFEIKQQQIIPEVFYWYLFPLYKKWQRIKLNA